MEREENTLSCQGTMVVMLTMLVDLLALSNESTPLYFSWFEKSRRDVPAHRHFPSRKTSTRDLYNRNGENSNKQFL